MMQNDHVSIVKQDSLLNNITVMCSLWRSKSYYCSALEILSFALHNPVAFWMLSWHYYPQTRLLGLVWNSLDRFEKGWCSHELHLARLGLAV